jgi:structural maintenance of chromosome 4
VATNTAYNLERRHRVVTVSGELIELSGTIAGGGRPRSGGMSSKIESQTYTDFLKDAERKQQKLLEEE